jgi:ankyrin repeat protein
MFYFIARRNRRLGFSIVLSKKPENSFPKFQTVIEVHPNYPLELNDVYGNTVFLLAFINGNEDLCRLALKYNVCLGASNHQGETIFRINTPTKQLLFGLLSRFKNA